MLGDKPKVREASKPAVVLVVDDDDHVRSVVVRVVEHLGYTPAPAASAEAALAISHEPSALALLITDLHLPAMSGVDLIALLRERSSDLPAILISGDLTPDACERARLLGGVELVAKPFELGELRALVERVGCRAPLQPPE
jgi:DNA-binding NtrC family response regulator